ncbi:MAG: hypothetical protein Q3976_05755 [Corynebacterium sp.]|nr:hypothetical protein [Corynebacterium sp.]
MTDNKTSLNLVLSGRTNDIDAAAVARGLDLLIKLVQSFTNETPKLSTLKEGSAITGVEVELQLEEEIHQGVSLLREHQSLPNGWTLGQAKYIQDIAKLTGYSGVEAVGLSRLDEPRTQLDKSLIEAISKIPESAPLEYGSVDGVLESYSARGGRLTARLRPLIGKNSIKVNFDEALDEDIRQGLRKTVNIYGAVISNPNDYEAEEIDAHEVTILDLDEEQESLRGIWSDLREQGITSDELMRGIRDDWAESA